MIKSFNYTVRRNLFFFICPPWMCMYCDNPLGKSDRIITFHTLFFSLVNVHSTTKNVPFYTKNNETGPKTVKWWYIKCGVKCEYRKKQTRGDFIMFILCSLPSATFLYISIWYLNLMLLLLALWLKSFEIWVGRNIKTFVSFYIFLWIFIHR